MDSFPFVLLLFSFFFAPTTQVSHRFVFIHVCGPHVVVAVCSLFGENDFQRTQ